MAPQVPTDDPPEKLRRERRRHRQMFTVALLSLLVGVIGVLGIAKGWKFQLPQLVAAGGGPPVPSSPTTGVPDWKPGEKPRLQRFELYSVMASDGTLEHGNVYSAPIGGASVSFTYQGRFNDNSVDDDASCKVLIRISGPPGFDDPSQSSTGCDTAGSTSTADRKLEFDNLIVGDYSISVTEQASGVQSVYNMKVVN